MTTDCANKNLSGVIRILNGMLLSMAILIEMQSKRQHIKFYPAVFVKFLTAAISKNSRVVFSAVSDGSYKEPNSFTWSQKLKSVLMIPCVF